MTEEEALLYTNVLANIPTDYQILSSDLNALAENYMIKVIFLQMEKDGIVQTSGRHTDLAISAILLPAGIVFRNNGGYVQRRRDDIQKKAIEDAKERDKINLERIKTIAAVASAIIALIALLISILIKNSTKESLSDFEKRLESLEKGDQSMESGNPNLIKPLDTIPPDSNN